MDEEMEFNEFGWNESNHFNFRPPRFGSDFRNNRYNNAYGDYRGGYGPPGKEPFVPPLGFGPQPMFMWGRGFGPGGPPMKRSSHEDRALKYLMRCGVAKENLKNLPRDLLQCIEPQHCGICGLTFDSFAMSRIHYLSKNHMKNQKKLQAKSEMAGKNLNKEVPLRARELYCELCDVQITSKVHADSHYSGKPHRAIVEGRKNPKNATLLKSNMSSRLEQLIRREKKHLKNVVAEPAAAAGAAGTVGKESKTIPPELYCDICKTSVTCTEQMTMHLNGKRHLNKEKQHILNMMKVGVHEKNDADKTEGTVAAETGESVVLVEEGEQKEDDSFDWGNGSGTWDVHEDEEKKDAE